MGRCLYSVCFEALDQALKVLPGIWIIKCRDLLPQFGDLGWRARALCRGARNDRKQFVCSAVGDSELYLYRAEFVIVQYPDQAVGFRRFERREQSVDRCGTTLDGRNGRFDTLLGLPL